MPHYNISTLKGRIQKEDKHLPGGKTVWLNK